MTGGEEHEPTTKAREDPSINDPIAYLSWIVRRAERGNWHLSGRDVAAIANAVEVLKSREET